MTTATDGDQPPSNGDGRAEAGSDGTKGLMAGWAVASRASRRDGRRGGRAGGPPEVLRELAAAAWRAVYDERLHGSPCAGLAASFGQPAKEDPKLQTRLALAFGSISMNETHSMAPAVNANEQDSSRRLVRLAKSASALPGPVPARPSASGQARSPVHLR